MFFLVEQHTQKLSGVTSLRKIYEILRGPSCGKYLKNQNRIQHAGMIKWKMGINK
jgi:hypothetical protein